MSLAAILPAAAGIALLVALCGIGLVLRRALRGMEAELARLGAAVEQVSGPRPAPASAEALSVVAAALSDDIDRLFARVSAVSEALQGQLDPIDQRMAAIERGFVAAVAEEPERGRSAVLEARIETVAAGLEDGLRRLRDSVEAASAAGDARHAETLARLDAAAADAQERAREAAARLADGFEAAAATAADVEGRLAERLDALERSASRSAKAAGGAEARLSERFETLRGAEADALRGRLDAVEAALEALRSVLADAAAAGGEAAAEGVAARIDALEAAMPRQLEAALDAHAAALDQAAAAQGRSVAAAERLDALERRLADLAAAGRDMHGVLRGIDAALAREPRGNAEASAESDSVRADGAARGSLMPVTEQPEPFVDANAPEGSSDEAASDDSDLPEESWGDVDGDDAGHEDDRTAAGPASNRDDRDSGASAEPSAAVAAPPSEPSVPPQQVHDAAPGAPSAAHPAAGGPEAARRRASRLVDLA